MNQADNESVLATLRALVPPRNLTHTESLRIAELQANRLLEMFRIAGPRVPSELVTKLPRLEVRLEVDLPASGSTHWERGRWVITLNASEPIVRQRFSLMHEFKHILDHTTRQYLYGDVAIDEQAAARAERAADQFAGFLLMPKRWIKREWFNNGQRLSLTARRFDVSPRALAVRLWLLGMANDTPRCAPPNAFVRGRDHTHYFRPAPLTEAVA
jgi:hypothetical protein